MVRVHELARELGQTSNELLNELQKMGSEAVKALNTVTAEEEQALRSKFSGRKVDEQETPDRAKDSKSIALGNNPDAYEPVRLRSRDAGIKRDFRGTGQSASSTLTPKTPSRSQTRKREQPTSTKIIKKTIVRKRYVRREDIAQGPPVVETPPPVQPVAQQPGPGTSMRRGRKRSSLSIEGGVLPKAQREEPAPREPVAAPKPPETEAPKRKPRKKERPGGRQRPPERPVGEKSDVADRTDKGEGQDRFHKKRKPKPAAAPFKGEADFKKSLEALQQKGIKSDLANVGQRAGGKKTKKKRKKILSQEKDTRFGKGDRRGMSKGRGSESRSGVRTTGPVRRRSRRKAGGRIEMPVKPLVKHRVKVTPSMTIKDLSEATGIKAGEIISFLVSDLGVMATINQVVDLDIIKLILENFDYEYDVKIREVEDEIEREPDKEEDLVPRPPVVVVLGHVDHGKTKLLDAIRHSNVIDTEAGAITQHIGAYQAVATGDRRITFLDTPGHEAFTAMRARGTQVTDIAILVVACDDGVMPQTIEAINHARDANLEIIVALNKIDKEGADPERIKSQLAEYGLLPEAWGGKTIMVPISAKFGQGIDDLLEMVLLATDMLNLKGNPSGRVEGTILESRLDKGLGVVATVLVQRGTLNPGTIVVCGATWGRVRQMTDEHSQPLDDAGPSRPVQLTGLSDVPIAGDKLYEVKDEKVAKDIYNQRQISRRMDRIHAENRISLEDFFKQLEKGVVKDLNLILKADVQGSIEAIVGAVEKLSTDKVTVRFTHTGVGSINENDVMLAVAAKAIIIGFTVDATPEAKRQAQIEGVDMRRYDIIYKVVEDIDLAIKGMLEPEYEERIIGRAEVRAVFRKTRDSVIAGLYVTEKKLVRGMDIRIFRAGELIHEGKLNSLKRFQEDAKEVEQDFECGIMLDGYNDLQEGDIIEGYEIVEVGRV